jgi:cell division control protein 6
MNMLGLISVYERNEGLSAGRYHEYELNVPLKAVLDVLVSTSRFEEVANIIQSTAEDNNLLQANLSNY